MKSYVNRLMASLLVVLFACPVLAATANTQDSDVMIITDLGMPIADISSPFVVLEDNDWGWCNANGVLSDLPIDLDNDGMPERLVVYFSQNAEEPTNDESGEGILRSKFVHSLGRMDLHLAIFKEMSGKFGKMADIIIEPSLALYYANIHVSVWGDSKKYIYLRSATMRYNHIHTRYNILTFDHDKLVVELALYAYTGPDNVGLRQLQVSDAGYLYQAANVDGDVVYRSLTYEEYLAFKDAGMVYREESSNIGIEVFCEEEENEPTRLSSPLFAALSEQLAPYGIVDGKDEDADICTPVCSIRFYHEHSSNVCFGQTVDNSGIVR